MKRLRHIYLLLTMLLTAAMSVHGMPLDKIPNVHVADTSRYVSDPGGYLSADALAKADSIVDSIWKATSAEVTAVIVDDLDGKDIDSAATELFEKWGIGKSDKDNGLLVLVSVKDRKAVFRTGYGLEGVLPDVICGRILREIMFPSFKKGDYDAGVVNSLGAVSKILKNPNNADELISKYRNDAFARQNRSGKSNLFRNYLILGIIAAIAMLVIVIGMYARSRGEERHERYEKLRRLSLPFLVATVGFFGIPVLAYLLLRNFMGKVRRHCPDCPNCGHKMRLIDEVHDNDYLTPAQDREEQLNSVDYDVWHCDNCGENEIIPYVNHRSGYDVCPNCGARASKLESNTIVRQPTEHSEGIGRKIYYCKNCHKRREDLYKIAKIVTPPLIIGGLGGRNGGGGGFGGGFGGGSFGGGMTGGGGASGGW